MYYIQEVRGSHQCCDRLIIRNKETGEQVGRTYFDDGGVDKAKAHTKLKELNRC